MMVKYDFKLGQTVCGMPEHSWYQSLVEAQYDKTQYPLLEGEVTSIFGNSNLTVKINEKYCNFYYNDVRQEYVCEDERGSICCVLYPDKGTAQNVLERGRLTNAIKHFFGRFSNITSLSLDTLRDIDRLIKEDQVKSKQEKPE